MNDPCNQAKSIFLAAIEEHAPEQWPGFLDQACTGDVRLRAEVEKLLRARSEMGSFHEPPRPAAVATVDAPVIAEGPGTTIGPYKLLEQIGEGGFGLVFMAEQQQPVRRKVALKILKPGMDTRQVIARFEAERQALALMDHPNIAKVLDAGETGSGRPHFVMELVKGVPITDYRDQNRLATRERLALFTHVCHAVQHAHHKGIIHRDLKPSNVMVTLHDGVPVVKVIDFGIAKALGQQLTDKTLFTGFAQLVGTPMYMSPEQAQLNGLDIDTRSDIYSLGVLLYELLAGVTPFDRERLRTAGHDEMRRIIREEDPPGPSTRLSTLGQAAVTVSAERQSDPKRLCRLLRGELDWIVMKALDKDRNRRYETAQGGASAHGGGGPGVAAGGRRRELGASGPGSAWQRTVRSQGRDGTNRERGALQDAAVAPAGWRGALRDEPGGGRRPGAVAPGGSVAGPSGDRLEDRKLLSTFMVTSSSDSGALSTGENETFAAPSLAITNCTFTGNEAVGSSGANNSTALFGGEALGGAMANAGPLTIANSTFTGNVAEGGDHGDNVGGLDPDPVLGEAWGGGLVNFASTLTITNTVFSCNQAIGGNSATGPGAPAAGGGLAAEIFADTTLTGVSSFGNQAIGGSGGSSSPGYAGTGGSGFDCATRTHTVLRRPDFESGTSAIYVVVENTSDTHDPRPSLHDREIGRLNSRPTEELGSSDRRRVDQSQSRPAPSSRSASRALALPVPRYVGYH